jgi:hypothetical protein
MNNIRETFRKIANDEMIILNMLMSELSKGKQY